MNTDAVRARNARKRAKARAKGRGESPNFQRIQLIFEFCEDPKFLDDFVNGCTPMTNDQVYRFTSQEFLQTAHECSCSVREGLSITLESWRERYMRIARDVYNRTTLENEFPLLYTWRLSLLVWNNIGREVSIWHGTGMDFEVTLEEVQEERSWCVRRLMLSLLSNRATS